jgi:DNA topoisomerase-1
MSPARPPSKTAQQARLHYVSCSDVGIRRIKRGKGFVYRAANGKLLRSPRELERIRKLALPPAWRAVWICPDPSGHLQATGFDAKGRKQYRYAKRWRAARDNAKYHELLEFSRNLPGLRQRLRRDVRSPGLSRDKVLATLVSLLAQTGVRVGNDRYQAENGSFGLTTLLDRHAKIERGVVQLAFKGKGGKPYRATVRDRALARIVKSCRDVPGPRLFQYVDASGARQWLAAADVNEYVHRASSTSFTAKTFRTWIASVHALVELRQLEPAASASQRKRQLNEALTTVAERLGNTLAICRKSYVHPYLMQAFLSGQLPPRSRTKREGLRAEECDLVSLLERTSRQLAAA